jgi:hypothetical protein
MGNVKSSWPWPPDTPSHHISLAGLRFCWGADELWTSSSGSEQVNRYLKRKNLRGINPAELPVEQHTKVEFSINLKTAKTLGVTFSIPLLGRADEVIE